jgi:hypothetical protein
MLLTRPSHAEFLLPLAPFGLLDVHTLVRYFELNSGRGTPEGWEGMERWHSMLTSSTGGSHHAFWFFLRMAFILVAVLVAVTEPWDGNGDGRISLHEVLLFPVRVLAFPIHLILSVTPSFALRTLNLPDAYWPTSAVVAVLLSLPLWGIVLIGGLILEAWLERGSQASVRRR